MPRKKRPLEDADVILCVSRVFIYRGSLFQTNKSRDELFHVRWFVGRCPRVVTFRLNELDKTRRPSPPSLAEAAAAEQQRQHRVLSFPLTSIHFTRPASKTFSSLFFLFWVGFWLMNFCLVCFLFQDCLAEPEKVGPTPYSRSRTRKFFCAVIRGPVDDEEDAGRRRSGARWCTADNKTPLPHHVARTESVGRSSGGHVFPPIYTLLCSTSNALIRPKRADGPRLTTSNEPRPFHSQSSGRAGPSSSSPFLSRLEYIREDTMLL